MAYTVSLVGTYQTRPYIKYKHTVRTLQEARTIYEQTPKPACVIDDYNRVILGTAPDENATEFWQLMNELQEQRITCQYCKQISCRCFSGDTY